MIKEECIAALDKLEDEIKAWMGTMTGSPSSQGHDRGRAMDRKFT